MKVYTVEECQHLGLEDSDTIFLPSFEQIKVNMSVQVFMYWSVPFPCILIEICSIPEILIKLAVCEACQFCIEIRTELKYQEKEAEINGQNGKIPVWEEVMEGVSRIWVFEENASQWNNDTLS